MKLSDFDYKLPNKYLAQYPSDERDECKLMLLNTKEQKVFVEDGIYGFMTKYNFLNLDIGYFNRLSYIVLEIF